VARRVAALAGLALLAAALRLLQAGDGLLGDELATLYDVRRSFGDLIGLLHRTDPVSTEFTPPLFFSLAWLADHVLGGVTAIRAPSLLAAVALVPALWALGRRTFGEGAGFVAAGAWALSPFAIYYGSEARAYALLALLSALSTLALLGALRDGGRGRWALVAVLAAAVVYTHYTGAMVILAQAAWALVAHPAQRRAVLLAHAGAALLFLPWLPFVRSEETLVIYASVGPSDPIGYVREALRAFPGHPYRELSDVPGLLAAALVGGAIAVGAAFAARRPPRRGLLGLFAALAVATPLGLLLLGAVSDGTPFLARSLAPSLPAVLLLAGAALTAPPRRVAAGLIAVALAGMSVGAVRASERTNRRPAYDELAAFVDARARQGEPVLVFTPFDPRTAGATYMAVQFRRPHPERRFGIAGEAVWTDPGLRAEQVFAVLPRTVGVAWLRRPPGPPGRYAAVEERAVAGLGSGDRVVRFARR
jgi:hypothetical protein